MATTNNTEPWQVVHEAAKSLATLEFMEQSAARELSQTAEAVANLLMVVFYQAETGRATHADFDEAMAVVRRALNLVPTKANCVTARGGESESHRRRRLAGMLGVQ
ncbi:type I toxin-antitoxin system ptaRNA1 family toxin [Burkholderia pseudomallei]|uniref:Type I toxin-antitoxin system ptaRNA1 family toxin n=1 Tax=Burkholderia stagnalis TaxID=1503054 RepID=A0ABX9YI21_9BURK|nr:type I toxin-antitoxin system ptaRNA1 family toxin [Burkholderia stagnalis]RQQ62490.1 type I toxin-antitoxin system ptaRNA1 family toxin [Burkholderia stagnalis]RQQ63209.1 type I toxin-antitoxin system ptaRNA1 family toxin [Burkholderia stagnalis]RQQ76752.1 type I toxin-antitoxin system ptaRNA1 family toxin [Burkholderia stagnalis]RQQ82720.1 type I toxin-antitoxin system ptaRNA1 family toxin [Burkholderia stagnalis]